jgi:hypothetical protein
MLMTSAAGRPGTGGKRCDAGGGHARAARPPNAGMGRKPGAHNKVTVAMKDAILGALDEVGGEAYLADIARKDHKTFCALLAKLVPRDVTDEAGGPVVAEIVRPLPARPSGDGCRPPAARADQRAG